jgi:thiol-disulfide isomerase/thioredoxin
MYILYFVLLLFSFNFISAEVISLEIKSNSNLKFNYYLLRLNSPPDTLLTMENRNIDYTVEIKTTYKLPMAVALHVCDLDGRHNRVFIFEIDSNFVSIFLDINKNDFTIKGSDFQTKFTELKNYINNLESNLKEQLLDPNNFKKEVINRLIKFIENYPTHPITYFTISGLINDFEDSKLLTLSNIINYAEIDNDQIRLIKNVIKASLKKRSSYKINDSLSGIKDLMNNNQNETNLNFEKGEYLVYVWSTWCGPCISKIDKFSKMKTRPKNINYVFISIDSDKNKWVNFLKNRKYKFESYLSIDNKILELFEINKLPFIIKIKNGLIEEIEPDISNYIY